MNCNLYTWQLLHTWPAEKPEISLFRREKKEILKNFYNDFIGRGVSPTNCAPLLNIIFKMYLVGFVIYIYLFITEHNPSFTLFLICSYFSPNLSFDVLIKCVLIKKRVYDSSYLRCFAKKVVVRILEKFFIKTYVKELY